MFIFQRVMQQELQYDRMLRELKGLKNVREVSWEYFKEQNFEGKDFRHQAKFCSIFTWLLY